MEVKSFVACFFYKWKSYKNPIWLLTEYMPSDLYENVLLLFLEYCKIFCIVWASELWFYDLFCWHNSSAAEKTAYLSLGLSLLSVLSTPSVLTIKFTFHSANLTKMVEDATSSYPQYTWQAEMDPRVVLQAVVGK